MTCAGARHVLQHGHREGGVEARRRERQPRGVGGGELRGDRLRAHRVARVAEPGVDQVDADEVDAARLQRRQDQLRGAGAAADVEHALAGPRQQRVLEERGEAGIPPAIAEVLERERRQGVDVARHQSSDAHSPGTIGRVRGRRPR